MTARTRRRPSGSGTGSHARRARGAAARRGLPGAVGAARVRRGARIARRCAAGRLHRLHTGVFAVGHLALTQRARELAAVKACGPDALLSHRSAGRRWGLIGTARLAWRCTARAVAAEAARHRAPSQPLDRGRRPGGTPRHPGRRASPARSSTSPTSSTSGGWRVPSTRRRSCGSSTSTRSRPRSIAAPAGGAPQARARPRRLPRASRLQHHKSGAPLRRALRAPRPAPPAARRPLPATSSTSTGPTRGSPWRWTAPASTRTRRAFHEDRVRDRRLAALGIQTARVTWLDLQADAETARELRAIRERRLTS